jgi:AAA+ superfamily predicted ATPase
LLVSTYTIETSCKTNKATTVFLRALEYYNGVLILTTNRVTSLDTAFRSRIHLGIKYQSLSVATRKNIWQTFLERSTSGSEVDVLGARLLDEFAAYQFDGRMIKNAVRMAHAVAVDEDIALNATHIRKAIEALEAFRHDMVEADEEEEKEKEGEEAEHQCTQTATSEGSRKRRRIS